MALKSYSEWKEGGGKGVWKFSGTAKPHSANKYFLRKNSDLFVNSLSRSSSNAEKSLDSYGDLGQDLHEMVCKFIVLTSYMYQIIAVFLCLRSDLMLPINYRVCRKPCTCMSVNFFLIRSKKIFHWYVIICFFQNATESSLSSNITYLLDQ